MNASASPFWLPSGIAIATALLFGLRIWPAIALGAFLVNVTTTGSLATSAGIAIGNTLEAVIAAELVNRFAAGSASFERPQGIVAFAALMVPPTAISATVGLFSLWAGGYAEPSEMLVVWSTWWLGDLGGALIFTPLIVLWSRRAGRRPVPGNVLEAVALALIRGGFDSMLHGGRYSCSVPVIGCRASWRMPRARNCGSACWAAMS